MASEGASTLSGWTKTREEIMEQKEPEKSKPQTNGIERKIPLALFTFNRPAHTASVLNSLAACEGRECFEFFFFSDAPRNVEDHGRVEAVRSLLWTRAPEFNAEVIEQSTNQGLSRSIVGGVNRLCASHGWVVVLEDDLVVEPTFLRFMAEALVFYEENSSIMQVAATTLAPPKRQVPGAFLLPVTSTWGWGTWQRAWNYFSWSPLGWPESKLDSDWLSVFEVGGAADYVSMLEDRIAGRNDSWGILWWYAVSRAKGRVVYPSVNLVNNIGFDGTGVHCGREALFKFPQESGRIKESWPQKSISFPEKNTVNTRDYKRLQAVLRTDSAPVASWKLHYRRFMAWMRGV